MADSAFLSRLPVKGAVFQSAGPEDAFKVPLLDAEGKINLSLVSNSATIYDASNTAGRLALTAAKPGDFCVQSDNNSIYFLKVVPPTQENSWIRLSTVEDSEQDFDSPNFTGIPTAPTASIGTSTTQIATTQFVKNLAGTEIPEGDSISGQTGTSIKFAREDHSHPSDTSRAPINNPAFTGTPTAPNPDYTENNTRLATTNFVKQQSIDGFTLPRTNVNLNNFRITSLGTPINERDAATKAYVDALQSGLTVREPVRVATTPLTGNINLSGSTTNIDGVVLNNGDRVLVKNQTNPAQNGIYSVNLGGVWQRTVDADSSLEMKNGVYVFILDGTINKNSAWVLVTSGNVNLNTTPLNFVYYTNQDANLILAGYGLIKETNTILVDASVVASVSLVATKQDTLVSGTSIKTINNSSILGSGNITLDKAAIGLGNVDNTADLNKPISTFVQAALDTKQDTLVSGTNIKTINNSSILGLGNLDLTPSWSSITDKPTTLSGYGITDAAPLSHTTDATLHLTSAQNTWLDSITATATEINYLSGVTSSIQTQLNNKQATLGYTAENAANKGIASGYAGLDSSGKVPSAQLPSYVDDVIEFNNLTELQATTGETGKIYIVLDTNKTYRWSGSTYIEISPSPGSTDSVAEGTTNLYFTAARAQAAVTSVTGNAGTATKLTTARSISASGDATWTVNFDGSINVTSPLTLANSGVTAGTYKSLTVNAKGLVTGGTNPTTLSGYGITDAQPLDADLTAIAALTGTTGFLKKTAADTWILDTATYLTGNQSISITGDATGSGSTSISLTLANSGVTQGTYNNVATEVRPFTVDTKGRITAIGAAVTIAPAWSSITSKPTTLSGYGITDAAPSSHVTDATVHLSSAQNTWIDSITATATEINYLSGVTSAVQTQLNSKQATLVSGNNIKTINGNSVLGSGDISITTSGVLTVSPNVGLAISNDNLSTIYNTTMSDTVQSTAVGGAVAAAASEWKTKTIVQVLDAILFPDVLPTYTVPTITLTGTQSGTKEVGESITQALTLVGNKNDAGAFTNLSLSVTNTAFGGGVNSSAVGSTTTPTTLTITAVPDQFGYLNPNTPNTSYTYTNSPTVTVISGTMSWSGTGNYNAGLAKKNNKGVNDTRTAAVRTATAPQASSTGFASGSVTVTGIYPYYWGVSSTQPTTATIAAAISAGTANRQLSDSTGTVSITFNATGQYVWFAHAGIYTAKTKWYNTDLNNGDIGAGNFILAPENQNMSAQNGRWTNISFKVYISGGATNTSGAIQFRNS